MPSRFLDRITPRASSRTRLLTAALAWTSVGLFLICKGVWISREAPVAQLSGSLAGIGLGVIKAWLILDRVAKKIVSRIGLKPHNACLGGLFSFRNWILILLMIVLGRIVGESHLSGTLTTCIYVMLGSGLAFSSRLMWSAWKKTALSELRRI
jgi:hypothetical protein